MSGPRRGVPADFLLTNTSQMVTCVAPAKGVAPAEAAAPTSASDGLGVIPAGVLAARDGRIVWVGPASRAAEEVDLLPGARVFDACGRLAMPGIVECHTHLVFGGERSAEFQLRVRGVSYEEIAAQGGGIRSTVAATRKASEEELFAVGMERLHSFLRYGVTTIEVKSGYGLSTDEELKILRVVRRLGDAQPVDVIATFLGAHTVPVEYCERRSAYLDLVVEEMIPAVAEAGLAEFCDVFCEEQAFSIEEGRRVLVAGARAGLRPKIHADQLTSGGGAELAAEVGAVSAEHLDHVSSRGVEVLVRAGVTAVLLPGAVFFLGQTRFAPARELLDAGVRVALSTDYNPGTCFSENVFLMGTIASCYMHMTAKEVIRALTLNAAYALGRGHEVGSLEPGKKADVVLLNVEGYETIPYHFGVNLVSGVIKESVPVWEAQEEG